MLPNRIKLLFLATIAPFVFVDAVLGLTSKKSPNICLVPFEYPSIQSAIDDVTCATVDIESGIYVENITVTRSVSIFGDALGSTILNGGGQWSVLTIQGEHDVHLKDLTITAGRREVPEDSTEGGGGVHILGANVMIEESKVAGNSAINGGGLYIKNGTLTLRNVTVEDNVAEDPLGDDGTRQRGGGVYISNSNVEMITSYIEGNTSIRRGGGIFVNNSSLTISNTEIQTNISRSGGGLYSSNSTLLLAGTVFQYNVVTVDGGGLRINEGMVYIEDSFIIDNDSLRGGGVFARDSSIHLLRTHLARNNAGLASAISISGFDGQPITITDSDIYQNGEENNVTALYVGDEFPTTIDSSRFVDNHNGAFTSRSDLIMTNTTFLNNNILLDSKYNALIRITGSSFVSSSLEFESGNVTLNNVSVTDSVSQCGVEGLAGGRLTIEKSAFLNNLTAICTSGGSTNIVDTEIAYSWNSGIRANGFVTITGGEIHHNLGEVGGGVSGEDEGSHLRIINSFLYSNTAKFQGGAIKAVGLELINSTILRNSAPSGGAIAVDNGRIENSTIVNNYGHGGIIFGVLEQLSILNTTVVSNTSLSDPIIWGTGVTTLENSIVANRDSVDCDSSVTTIFPNLDGDGSCDDSLTGDPLLGPLQDNGGATPTMALLAGSPAIDAGNNATCLTEDQRGFPRPFGSACDLGAYELGNVTASLLSSSTMVSEGDDSAVITVALDLPLPYTATVDYQTIDETALAGEDFVSASGTLEIAPNTQLAMVTIDLIDNIFWEPNETFIVMLDNAVGVELGEPDEMVVTIIDDDPVRVAMESAEVGISETAGFATITVTLDVIYPFSVTVEYVTWAGSATANLDYTAVSGELFFPSNESVRHIQVPILDDVLFEDDETFDIQLISADGAVIGTLDTTTITIHDDEVMYYTWLPLLQR